MRNRYPIARDPTALKVNGVELCVQTFGDRDERAILLIMGGAGSMDWWEDDFCERLAAGGRFVIRYDHRDTGGSVVYPAGAPGYTGDDLVADAIGVLDALEAAPAHLVGMSMGAGLAQVVALERPELVSSLTLISTTAATGELSGLPGMSPEAAARFAVDTPDWSDRQAVIDHMVHLARASASPARRFDDALFRHFAARVLDRTRDVKAAMTNHDVMERGDPPAGGLADLAIPTLVIHGRDDPLFPLPHGEALSDRIPGARLLVLDATGHELPREAWDTVIPAILALAD